MTLFIVPLNLQHPRVQFGPSLGSVCTEYSESGCCWFLIKVAETPQTLNVTQSADVGTSCTGPYESLEKLMGAVRSRSDWMWILL